MNASPKTISIERYLAIDIHKHYVMVGGQNQQQEWTLRPRRVQMIRFRDWAAKEMNVDPKACLMIGDTTEDIHAGRAAGAHTVAVLSSFEEAPELGAAGADIVLPSVVSLPAVLLA
jgi:phosphoglycolate phosphatase-like HAD superfamily hydrolase